MTMTLQEAIAEVQLRSVNGQYWPGVYGSADVAEAILNAAASGDLIPASDARLAVALAYQKAAAIGGQTGSLMSWERRKRILALADQDALAEVQALRAEVARLREVERDQIEARVEAVARRNFVAPEDAAVEALCVRFGYGAVMDAASRLWARRDMLGAFYIGGCIGFRTEEEARAVLQETKP